jgi:acyl-coenzyme A synthetase/AMP-(fatty) acid ligase
VRDNGGHAVALRWSIEHIMNTKPGEVYFAASDIGWVVGHTYVSLFISNNYWSLIPLISFMHH